ncbi:MAG: protein-glutamate O-methyltransferase CheR [Thalassobaculum sp.]|uniref:CheR family methyltransferase n=1 Tax=Thalassobaculum sp. TaxID=2022740 RepID=UPI0032EFFA07
MRRPPHGRRPPVPRRPPAPAPRSRSSRATLASIDVTGAEFGAFRRLMHSRFGIVLPDDAENFLRSRLLGYIGQSGHASIAELIRDARSEGRDELLGEVVEQLSTNHSYFYREPAHFEFLQATVLPELERRLSRGGRGDIRIWSAAAAAGEEAYTIAMAMRSFFGPRYDNLDAGVLATDIAARSLRRGAIGEFKADAFRHLPEAWRSRFLEPAGGDVYRVVKAVRDDVMFRWLNLVEPLDRLKGGFHLIFCRNVMIYFDDATREKLVRELERLLAPGGYLFIGHTDNPDHSRQYLDQVRPAIFRKRGTA